MLPCLPLEMPLQHQHQEPQLQTQEPIVIPSILPAAKPQTNEIFEHTLESEDVAAASARRLGAAQGIATHPQRQRSVWQTWCSRCARCPPQRQRWSQPTHPDELCRYTLRFKDEGVEKGFVQASSHRLMRNLHLCSGLVMLFCGVNLATVSYSGHDYPSEEFYLLKMRSIWFDRMLFIWSVACVACTKAQLKFAILPAGLVEYLVVVMGLLALLLAIFTEPWYLAKMQGVKDPAAAYGYTGFSDSFTLLAIDIVVTATHVAMPIRWCILWIVEAVGFLIYPALVMAFSMPQQSEWVSSFATLSILNLFAVLGRRHIERYEREAFTNVLRERTLRAETEFKLTQIKLRSDRCHCCCQGLPSCSVKERHHATTVHSLHESRSTTSTGRLFNAIPGATNEVKLQHFVAVGTAEHWLIRPRDMLLAPGQMLGRGGFGIVVAGTFHGSPVAVKLAKQAASPNADVDRFEDIANELRVLRYVRHPNIAMFHGAVVDVARQEMAIVLELVDGPSLQNFVLFNFASLPTPTEAWDRDRFTLLMGICRALQYLHRHEPVIVHGDLKPNNIVVEIRGKKVNAKLLDFGLWRVLKHRAKPLGGTSAWAAPEVWRVKGGAPCAAADIYSFGRLIHFLATALLPAQSQSRGSNAAAAAASPAHIQQLSKAPWPADPRPFELACRAVADPCTTEDRDDRPSIEEIGGQLLSWQRRPALKHLQDPRQLMQVLSIAETAMRDPPSVDATGSLVVWDVGLQQCRESLLLAARRSGSGRRRHGRREEGSSHSVESDATAPWKPEELLGSGSSLQNHIPTPLDTRSSMLARLMERWVPTDSELGCCPFHQAALVVQDTLQDLAGFQCNKVFRFGGDYTQQCPDCLAMLGEDHTGPCDVCGHTVPGKSQFLLEAKTCLTGRMTL
mmetsp:Transcript_57935/g.126985  ORF Transcript_57935/g.126985 Transcript_57935/m.126985 type:complete len:904 (+) Transcript_57935:516-3227(+)